MDQAISNSPDVRAGEGFGKYAIPELLQAVSTAAITRVHGQLLAALREPAQESAVKALMSLECVPAADDVRMSIEANAVNLQTAAFDKSDCASCRFNSDNHADLFGASIRPGMCVHRECATRKHETMMADVHARLVGSYRVVRIRPANDAAAPTIRDEDVGAAQAMQCRNECAEFGAILSGSVSDPIRRQVDVCTNAKCHSEKVEQERLAHLHTIRDKLWRNALAMHVSALPRKANRECLVAMLSLGWQGSDDLISAVCSGGAGDRLAQVMKMAEPDLVALTDQLASNLCRKAPIHQVREFLVHLKVSLESYSRMSKPFLLKLSVKELDGFLADMCIDMTTELRKARMAGRLSFAQAIIDCTPDEKLVGYVPAVFRP